MNFKPFFSIIIPTYNRKAYIGQTIESALKQSEKDCEIILIDDGSTDGTLEYVETNYPEVICQAIPNSERGAARNTGAKIAKGNYLYFLDSDDILYPNHLEEAKKFIDRNNTPPWFFQEYLIRSKDKKQRVSYNQLNPFKTLVEKGNFMSCHGVFLRKDIALANPFVEDRKMAGSEDYELWIRIGLQHKLIASPIVTSELLNHQERSVFNFKPEVLIQRKLLFLKAVLCNKSLHTINPNPSKLLKSNTYSYIALHIALTGKKRIETFRWWSKSIAQNPASLFSKRSMAIVKYLLLSPKNA